MGARNVPTVQGDRKSQERGSCLGCNRPSFTLYCDGCAPPSLARQMADKADKDGRDTMLAYYGQHMEKYRIADRRHNSEPFLD